MHWNFFFTLGLLAPVLTVLRLVFRGINECIVAIIVGGAYQLALEYTPLKRWALVGPRNNLLTQNREGIVSMLGMWSLLLIKGTRPYFWEG